MIEKNCQVVDLIPCKKDIVLNPHIKVQSIEAVKRCVMNNLKIAIVPNYFVVEELKNSSLMSIRTELDYIIYHSIYVYHKNK